MLAVNVAVDSFSIGTFMFPAVVLFFVSLGVAFYALMKGRILVIAVGLIAAILVVVGTVSLGNSRQTNLEASAEAGIEDIENHYDIRFSAIGVESFTKLVERDDSDTLRVEFNTDDGYFPYDAVLAVVDRSEGDSAATIQLQVASDYDDETFTEYK